MWSFVSPVIMSKTVVVNGSYFMSIQLKIKITKPPPMVRSFYPFSHLPVLFSEVLLSLFVGYNFKIMF